MRLLPTWRLYVQALETNNPTPVQELDPRIIQVSIEVNGKIRKYQLLNMVITGMKYANENQDECEISISNLDKETRDQILTETTPFNLNKTPKTVAVYAGRQSYGTTLIYVGEITASSVSQPPDITITLKCLTKNFQKGNIVSRNEGPTISLSKLSAGIASDIGADLNFQADDFTITNYIFSGAALKQIGQLNSLGKINAYVDNNVLVVKNSNAPLPARTRTLDLNTGMIGIPEFTEEGIRVKYLLDNISVLGGALNITSVIYPAINGVYVIYKLGFEIATRETPFYYIAEAKRI